jgi:ubiquinone/menaquinone biosynthesis C-methylase UbiE
LEQEQKISVAFSKQSSSFDEADSSNVILQWMRSRIREHVLTLWKPGERILELNAGTGLDAVFFAKKRIYIHATDNASGMLNIIEEKIKTKNLGNKISTQRCSFLELENIKEEKFDHIFSNFGGLNCTDKLSNVIDSFSSLLKPGGTITLVIMPPICPWELLFSLKGNFKLAFRRLKKGGTPSHLEGVEFTTWYYSSSTVKKMFGMHYTILSITGLGIIVPPPFLGNFASNYPRLFRGLIAIENRIAHKTPFNSWADHFIISAKKLT